MKYYPIAFFAALLLSSGPSKAVSEYEQCLPYLEADLELQQGMDALYDNDPEVAMFIQIHDLNGFIDIWNASETEIREFTKVSFSFSRRVTNWKRRYSELDQQWYDAVDAVWTGARSDNSKVQRNLYINITEQCQIRFGG